MIDSIALGGSSLRSIRAVAYHNVDNAMVPSFRRQLAHYKRWYDNVDENDLIRFFSKDGDRKIVDEPKRQRLKQGIIITFDDGLSNHYKVAAPLLEEFGFKGWFFIPAGMPELTAEEQRKFCLDNHLLAPKTPEGRIGMSVDEILDLESRGHVIGCHTMNHRRFSGPVDSVIADREIRDAKNALRSMAKRPILSFAWVGGEPETYNAVAQRVIVDENFRFSFTTLSRKIDKKSNPLLLHRTVLDAEMAYPLFRAKLSGLSDIRHSIRRRSIETRLAIQ
ncbi:MAG: polysaccharide deacetylase family protein [Spirochaetia bacterium]|jgi:peptidoglycan/xylan/chitin deacetylase (PgdA/CDA1 family)|nr:polysaccharide deacetylase family protein [Spirochaetia bacterium]